MSARFVNSIAAGLIGVAPAFLLTAMIRYDNFPRATALATVGCLCCLLAIAIKVVFSEK